MVEEKEAIQPADSLPIAHPTFSAGASLRQLFSLTAIQFRETTKNVFFVVLMLAGFLFSLLSAAGINDPQASRTWPVTNQMLLMASGGFAIFAFAIIIFYSGELVWRERDAELNQVMDALPMQRWVLFCSKLFALMLVQVIVVLLIMASGLVVQVAQGYYHFELGLYFRELFLNRLTQLWILCVLAMFVQTLVNQKYLGHFVMVLYLIATLALPPAGFEDYLYRFGQTPRLVYSDINGYGPYLAPVFWIRLYWAIAAVLLAILTNLLWVRGTESNWRVRMSLAAARFSRSTMAGATVCVALMLGVGGYIFYNTHVLNPYRTTSKIDEDRAQYEKKYRQYWSLPQPRITDVTTEIDIYPEKRSVSAHGTIWLENKTSSGHRSGCHHHLATRPRAATPSPHPGQAAQLCRRPGRAHRRSVAGLLSLQAAARHCRRKAAFSSITHCNTTIRVSRTRSLTPTSFITGASSTIDTSLTSATPPRSN